MAQEVNPGVRTAPTNGTFGILGNDQSGMSGPPKLDLPTIDPGTLTQTPGMPDFGSMSDSDLSKYLGSPDFNNILSGLSGLTGAAGGASGAKANTTSSGLTDWLKNFLMGSPGNGLSGLGPYAAVGALGINQAKSAQKENEKRADELKALGQPFIDQANATLKQYQSGTLRPDQQNVVDLAKQQGADILGSVSPLQKIAQQAFADYSAGKLPEADELKMQQSVQAQKQQVRDMMSRNGITDSSILAGQDQQIDNQAKIARQDLLNQRFATGNQAYDEWLTGTRAGQQLQMQGQQFASQAFETMLQDSLQLGAEGMAPMSEAIALKIQSDAQLSQQINDLLGNLASAYSYAVAGGGAGAAAGGGGGGGGGGAGGNTLASIVSGIGGLSNLVSGIGKMFTGGPKAAGGEAATQKPAGATTPLPYTDSLDFGSQWNNMNDTELAKSLGSTGAMNAIDAAGKPSASDVLGTASSDALGAYNVYSGIKQGGVEGYGEAVQGASKLAGYDISSAPVFTLAKAGQQVAKGDVGGAGVTVASAAVPLAGVGFALAAGANKAFFGKGSEHRNAAAFQGVMGGQPVTYGRVPLYALQDGTLLNSQDFRDLAGAWYGATYAPDGDQAGWQQKYQDVLARIKPMKGLKFKDGKVVKE